MSWKIENFWCPFSMWLEWPWNEIISWSRSDPLSGRCLTGALLWSNAGLLLQSNKMKSCDFNPLSNQNYSHKYVNQKLWCWFTLCFLRGIIGTIFRTLLSSNAGAQTKSIIFSDWKKVDWWWWWKSDLHVHWNNFGNDFLWFSGQFDKTLCCFQATSPMKPVSRCYYNLGHNWCLCP